MTTKVSLRLSGVDFRDPAAFEQLPAELEDVMFEAVGELSLATLFLDGPAPELEALTWARRIEETLTGVEVAGLHDELVSLTEIAARCAVGAEAVRLWASGRRRAQLRAFPAPAEVIGAAGGKLMHLYRWRAVVGWVREVLDRDPEEGTDFLDDAATTHLAWMLASSRRGAGTPFEILVTGTRAALPVGMHLIGAGAIGAQLPAEMIRTLADVRPWLAALRSPAQQTTAPDFAFGRMSTHAIFSGKLVRNAEPDSGAQGAPRSAMRR